jgi:peptidoglycan/LPS O-acetylase OafA/YrhL
MTKSEKQIYRADIDGLRAVAVGIVVAFHAFPSWLKGGFVGVDIFFVISGYLISSIIVADLVNDRFSFVDFYSRRVRRIFPAMLVVLLCCVVFGWYVLLPDEFLQLGRHVLAGLFFVSNFVLWSENGYFDTAGETKPLLHLWSLGIEEQYYLIWPVFLCLLFRRHARIMLWIGAFSLVSFIFNIYVVANNETSAFYNPLARFWELSCGALVACFQAFRPEVLRRLQEQYGNAISVLGMIFIISAIFCIDESKQFPGWWAAMPVIGTVLLILAGGSAIFNLRILSHRYIVWVGTISYPLYLWHWPLLTFLWICYGGLPTPSLKLMAVAASVLLAWLTYIIVEKPFRFGILRTSSVKLLVRSSVALTALVSLMFFGEFVPRHNSMDIQKIVKASNDIEFPGGFTKFRAGSVFFNSLETGSSDITLFLGDSHIQHYGPRIREISKSRSGSVRTAVFATLGGCAPVPQVHDSHNEPECDQMRREAITFASDPRVKAIVIGACWNCYFIQQVAGDGPMAYYFDTGRERILFRGENGVEHAKQRLGKFLQELSETGKPIYFILDNPYDERLDPKTYMAGNRLSTEMSVLSIPESIPSSSQEARLHALLHELALQSGAKVLDPRMDVCSDELCMLFDSTGSFIFQDRNHFTADYVRRRATFIDRTLFDMTPAVENR